MALAPLRVLSAFGLLAAALAQVGCGGCRNGPDESELPIIDCEPLPSGSEGCVGRPGEDAGGVGRTYPVGCYATAASGFGECGSEELRCDSFGSAAGVPLPTKWVHVAR